MMDWLMVLAPIKCHWTSQGRRDSTLVQGCGANWIHFGSQDCGTRNIDGAGKASTALLSMAQSPQV